MDMKNCWEYKKCGREIDGINVKTLGVCPAATFISADGFCGGKNGGRSCMYITGTFNIATFLSAGGISAGENCGKVKNCVKCDFYKQIKKESPLESSVLQFTKYIRHKITPKKLPVAIA